MNITHCSYRCNGHTFNTAEKLLENLTQTRCFSRPVLTNVWKNAPLQWSYNRRDSVSNHQPHHCLLNRLFRRRSNKTWKLCVTGLCVGSSPGTGEFPAQMASYSENVSIWWRHHAQIFQHVFAKTSKFLKYNELKVLKPSINVSTKTFLSNVFCKFCKRKTGMLRYSTKTTWLRIDAILYTPQPNVL